MLTLNQLNSIDECLKLDIPTTEIAKRVGVSRPTVYKRKRIVIQNLNPKTNRVIKWEREINKYEPHIKVALKRKITNKKVIRSILKEKGYVVSYSKTNRIIKEIERRKRKGYDPSKKRETNPGEEAQIDWGYFGEIFLNGKLTKIWFFVLVLGYSRCIYVEFTVNQSRDTLKQCLFNAFTKLGIPRTVLCDNMKTVVKERIKDYIKISPEFSDFAEYLGFTVVVCAPHHPRSKGKVEAAVKFVKQNFVQWLRYNYKRNEITLDLLNQEVQKWVKEQNARKHDKTHKKPVFLWNKEKKFLYFPDARKMASLLAPLETRKVSKDGYIFYNGSSPFQIPREYIEEMVDIRKTNEHGVSHIEVYFKNKLIAKYLLSGDKQPKNLLDTQAITNKQSNNSKNRTRQHSLKLNYTSKIPRDGFYKPEGYYSQLTTYRRGDGEKSNS